MLTFRNRLAHGRRVDRSISHESLRSDARGTDGGFQRVQSNIDIDTPIEEGSVSYERGKPGLRRGTYRWEITVCDRPHRTVHAQRSGELDAELELMLEPIDDERTRYVLRLWLRAFPAFRPFGYLL
jgi:hypothetical protein